jgi:DNA repair protein RadA/Sms
LPLPLSKSPCQTVVALLSLAIGTSAFGDILDYRVRLSPLLPCKAVGAAPYDRRIAKSKPKFSCSGCGHEALAWTGQCPGCGEWNTLEKSLAAAAGSRGAGRRSTSAAAGRPMRLREVKPSRSGRLETGIGELDRVLGGGLQPGSLVLIGGSPGIGKSTLTGMALANLSQSGRRVLYVSGEESAAQVRLRAERLGEEALEVPVLASCSLEEVIATLESERPEACVIDSVQSMYGADSTGAPGSVAQVREVAAAIMETAKRLEIATLLVGHVTKEGALAGPRALEHVVDCVLHFEGERERTYRTLRALKNRFGATSEVGVFEMRSGGLIEVADPSARFVAEARPAPGSVVLCAMEGTRPVLVEVQALVAPTEIVPPRRTATGVDRNRLGLVLAVLARHGGLQLGSADVFVNVAGGVRIDEPGADLAVALAIVSAHSGKPLAAGDRPLACFGELGLTGELRYVGHPDRRVAEAKKFGLAPVLGPDPGDEAGPKGLKPCDSLAAAIAAARSGTSAPKRLSKAA